jgi:thiol-disulfide isomerase/thioredoxin
MMRTLTLLAVLGLAGEVCSAAVTAKAGKDKAGADKADAAKAKPLNIGDKAPKLEVKEFLKGKPIKNFAKGKLYVVEFWATWCGPCRVSIPHLTELQKKYRDVTFIGVSVWERDQAAVKPFVDEMGDKMDYLVALDAVPKDAEGNEGAMAKAWMTAAGENGIPSAFIINKETQIAWIGHPMSMDKPLEDIVKGKWDLKAAAAEREKAKAADLALAKASEKIRAAQQTRDPAKVLAAIDEVVKDNPDLEPRLAGLRLNILLSMPDKAGEAAAFARKLADGAFKDNAMALNQIAWQIVDPKAPKPTPELIKAAVYAAERGVKLTEEKDAALLDTLAKAVFDDGDAKRALALQEKAVTLAKGTPLEQDGEMQGRLEQYKKAAAE